MSKQLEYEYEKGLVATEKMNSALYKMENLTYPTNYYSPDGNVANEVCKFSIAFDNTNKILLEYLGNITKNIQDLNSMFNEIVESIESEIVEKGVNNGI